MSQILDKIQIVANDITSVRSSLMEKGFSIDDSTPLTEISGIISETQILGGTEIDTINEWLDKINQEEL